jgi:hypothetical protein
MSCGTGCAAAILGLLVAIATANPLFGAIVVVGADVADKILRRRT